MERRERKDDERISSCRIGLSQLIVEPSRIDLSTGTRRHSRYKSRVALAWNLGRATRLCRAGVVSERTSVGGPDKERITSRRDERARGHRFLRSLGEEWRGDPDVRDRLH